MRARAVRRGRLDASRAPAPHPLERRRCGPVGVAAGPAVTADAQRELHRLARLPRGFDVRTNGFAVFVHGRTPRRRPGWYDPRATARLSRRKFPPQAVCGTFAIDSW